MTVETAAGWVQRRQGYAWLVGAGLWATWLGGLLVNGGGHDPAGQLVAADHLAMYTAARLILDGRSADMYRLDVMAEYQPTLVPPGRWTGLSAPRRPPFYQLLFLPTAGLTYTGSAWVWVGVSVGCLVGAVRLLGPADPWRATLWAATFAPVFYAVGYGQSSLQSLLVFAAAYRLLANGHRFAAGLVAGLLWAKPPLLLGLLVWWTLSARTLWPCLIGLTTAGAALTAGSYLIIPEAWQEFVATLGENAGYDQFDWWKMQGPRSFWRLLLPGTGPLPVVLWLATAAAGVAVFARLRAARPGDVPVLFGASVALMLWVSPHPMIYEWAAAVVPAVLWWENVPERRPAWRVLFAVAWVALLAATDLGRWQAAAQAGRGWAGVPVVVQATVPVLGWVGFRSGPLLASGNPPAGGPPP